MNALLQHRGHVLMGAGHSIAVQNFNENSRHPRDGRALRAAHVGSLPIYTVVVIFGLFVSSTMVLVRRRHAYNLRKGGIPAIPTQAH